MVDGTPVDSSITKDIIPQPSALIHLHHPSAISNLPSYSFHLLPSGRLRGSPYSHWFFLPKKPTSGHIPIGSCSLKPIVPWPTYLYLATQITSSFTHHTSLQSPSNPQSAKVQQDALPADSGNPDNRHAPRHQRSAAASVPSPQDWINVNIRNEYYFSTEIASPVAKIVKIRIRTKYFTIYLWPSATKVNHHSSVPLFFNKLREWLF